MADKPRRAQAPRFTTGKGPFRFPNLSEVNFGSDEYPAPAGRYNVDMLVPENEGWVQDLIAKLRPLHDRAIAKGEIAFAALPVASRKRLKELTVNPFYIEETDKDTEEPTGNIIFKFKVKASVESTKGKNIGKIWDTRPTVFGKDGVTKLVPGFRFQQREDGLDIKDVHKRVLPIIGGGTLGKVSFEVGLDKDDEPGYFVTGTGMAGITLTLAAAQVIELVEGGDRSGDSYGFGNEGDETPVDMPENGDF